MSTLQCIATDDREETSVQEPIGALLIAWERFANHQKARRLRFKFKAAGPKSRLEWPIKVQGAKYINLGKGVIIAWNGYLCAIENYFGQQFQPEIHIDDHTYIGNNSHLVACRRIAIGKSVLVADGVYISDNLHGYQDIHTSILRNPMLVPGEVSIGDSSWIGENVCIFGDVQIGKHCVVGANSVCTRSLPDYSVAVGAPARIIRRYDPAREAWCKTDAQGNFLDP
jgi:acetyltransferase-like isoleucine patch superfamily enzyme